MPIEVEHLAEKVAIAFELQADLIGLFLPALEGESWLTCLTVNIWAEFHLTAVLDDRVGARS